MISVFTTRGERCVHRDADHMAVVNGVLVLLTDDPDASEDAQLVAMFGADHWSHAERKVVPANETTKS